MACGHLRYFRAQRGGRPQLICQPHKGMIVEFVWDLFDFVFGFHLCKFVFLNSGAWLLRSPEQMGQNHGGIKQKRRL